VSFRFDIGRPIWNCRRQCFATLPLAVKLEANVAEFAMNCLAPVFYMTNTPHTVLLVNPIG
jgi:hypothetical protein